MLQVANHTPFSAALSVFPDPAGVETAYAVVKATFRLGAQGAELAEQQAPLLATDVFWGDPLKTSLRAVAEFALLKPATDVLLVGHAYAPAPNTRVADVTLRVGPVVRTVRVFGDRHWQKSAGSWRASSPAPWERMPLRWELAFGGVAQATGDEVPPHEPRNPIGRGIGERDGVPTEGQPLPNLEDPTALLSSPKDRPKPAGFGPIAPTWQPRLGYAGTYDEAWIKGRAPYLPLDFDPRFFQVAPPELIAPGLLQGGEPVELQGFTPGPPLRFELPACGLELEFDFDGAKMQKPPQLEMLLFEPDLGRLQMLWRAALAVDKKLLKLKTLAVRSSVYERNGSPASPLRALGNLPPAYAATA
jgi:hypothetical protein